MQSYTTTVYQRVGPATTRRLGPVQSPVVSAAITRRVKEVRAFTALNRAIASVCLALVLLVDWYFGFSSILLNDMAYLLVYYTETVLIVLLLLNFLHDITLYAGTLLMQGPIPLTVDQCRMLGLMEDETGCDLVQDPIPFGDPVSSTPIAGHASVYPHYYMTPMSSAHSSAHSTPHSSSAYSAHSPTPSSIHGQSVTRGYKASPFSKEPVSDARSLEQYLKQEEEREEHLLRGSLDMTPSQGYGSHLSSHTPSPRKYHIAPRSNSPSVHRGDYDSPLSRRSDTSLESYGVKKMDLDRWTERCRKWIALSVIKPLADEMRTINSTLARKGITEQIGSVSISSLKHVAKSQAQHLPTLTLVIPYLEVSAKQEYLVQRIKELAQGSYLSAYRWNSGGSWKGRSWSIDLPNDSQIVMHLLSTYLDNHLPPDPWFPNGKTFSTQYFLKAPPRNGSKKEGVCIVQDNSNPPNYKVLCKGKYLEVSEGRNNLFHSICIFLYHVKNGEKSMLGSINLETAGINILSIISSSD